MCLIRNTCLATVYRFIKISLIQKRIKRDKIKVIKSLLLHLILLSNKKIIFPKHFSNISPYKFL